MMAIFPQDDAEWTDEQKKANYDTSTKTESNSSGCSVQPMVICHEVTDSCWRKGLRNE